jgi:hypothetical protein
VNCNEVNQWTETTLSSSVLFDKPSLAFSSAGQPRLAFGFFDANSDLSLADTGLPFGSEDGVDLAMDKLNRPRMSFETPGQGLGFAWCNTNCESNTASWLCQEVESQAFLADNYEVLPIHRCTVSTWLLVLKPARINAGPVQLPAAHSMSGRYS